MGHASDQNRRDKPILPTVYLISRSILNSILIGLPKELRQFMIWKGLADMSLI